MSILPADPVKRRAMFKKIRLGLIILTLGYIIIVVFKIAGINETDKRAFVYKACVKDVYETEIDYNHAKIKYESQPTEEHKKELEKFENKYNLAKEYRAKALNAMKEIGLEHKAKFIDNEIEQKYK